MGSCARCQTGLEALSKAREHILKIWFRALINGLTKWFYVAVDETLGNSGATEYNHLKKSADTRINLEFLEMETYIRY